MMKKTENNNNIKLFVLSVLSLYLELLCIRYISTEVRIFAYLQNTILIVCFLGLGMGCFSCRRNIDMRASVISLLLILIFFSIPPIRNSFNAISTLLSVLGDLVIWYQALDQSLMMTILYVCTGLTLSFFLMLLLWKVFYAIGQRLGLLLDEHPHPIRAYSINIAGSLVGTWLFVGMSIYNTTPVYWFAVISFLFSFLLPLHGLTGKINIGLLAGLVLFSYTATRLYSGIEVIWSPYQKLTFNRLDVNNPQTIGESVILANNVGLQNFNNLSKQYVSAHPERYDSKLRGLSQYDLPALLHRNPKSILLVGAGGGNDAAGALRNNIPDITAVEIDPGVILLGKKYHPEQPYQNEKVHIVNDDARSFFAKANRHYDVISFGILDSHTTTSMTNARLDHYVYTLESIKRAKSLLNPGGIIVLMFEAEKPYITDRMAHLLYEVFKQEPLSFAMPLTAYGGGGVTFVAGDLDMVKGQMAKYPRLGNTIVQWQKDRPLRISYNTKITTDDWPYIYLKEPRIPLLYFLLMMVVGALYFFTSRLEQIPFTLIKWDHNSWHFFFLGAAFLLLEVQNISKAAVVLGNTWWVNAVIISSILIMILLANYLTAYAKNIPIKVIYGLLIVSCLALYFIDIAQFAFLHFFEKVMIIGTLTALPMFFSGMVFIASFSVCPDKSKSLGANLFGALVGGLMQSLSFIIGIKALLLIVAMLYFLAVMTSPFTFVRNPEK